MSVIVIGLNHRTGPLDLLERTTVAASDLPKVLHDLRSRPHVREAVVLSTCNRSEVYVLAERFHGASQDVRDALARAGGLAPEELSDHLYTFHDAAAVTHLFSVAAGLDSAVLGESEILGQVKSAWDTARREGAAGPVTNMLFRRAVEVGKRARTETAIGRHITSVSQAAVVLATERLGTLADKRVLVLGAGDMGEGMLAALDATGPTELVVANRTWERAVELAERYGARPLRLEDAGEALVHADVLLTSTGAPGILLERDDLALVTAAREARPLLIVDVAVPRDVDPSAADLPGLTLLDMDDLRAFTEAGLAERRREVARVREIVEEEVDRYLDAAMARAAAPLVASLRTRLEELRAAEAERLGRRLEPTDRAAVDAVTRAVLAKLLHEPTVRLKDAAGTPRGERLAEALRELFDL